MAGVNDVVAALRTEVGGTDPYRRRVLDQVPEAIVVVLTRDGAVRLPLGTFRIVARKGGAGRNPRTGEAVAIPPMRVVKFKTSDRLKARIGAAGPGG